MAPAAAADAAAGGKDVQRSGDSFDDVDVHDMQILSRLHGCQDQYTKPEPRV